MPFDLEKGPLLKLIIIQLAKRQYVFATIAHNNKHCYIIIRDGWSNSMMFHELVSIAKVLSEEDALSLPDPVDPEVKYSIPSCPLVRLNAKLSFRSLWDPTD